jgi:hypothetical protein
MREAILRAPRGLCFSHRDSTTSPILELAHVLLHRARQAGNFDHILNNGDWTHVANAVMGSRCIGPNTLGSVGEDKLLILQCPNGANM